MHKDKSDSKKNSGNQNKTQSVPASLFEIEAMFHMFLAFLGISVAPQLISRLHFHYSEKYWKQRIDSDFNIKTIPQEKYSLSFFSIYLNFKNLFKTWGYSRGTRWGDPLDPVYLQYQLSDEQLDARGWEPSFDHALGARNWQLIEWLTHPDRGSDRIDLIKYLSSKPYSKDFNYKQLENLLPTIDEKHKLNKILFGLAADRKDENLMEKWISSNKDQLDTSTLSIAMRARCFRIAKMLIEQYDIQVDEDLLYLAAKFSNLELYNLILSKDKDLKPEQLTLSHASLSGNRYLVELILSAGITPDRQTLCYAVQSRNLSLVNFLFDKFGHNHNSDTLNAAAESGHIDLVNLIINKNIIPDAETLNCAVKSGNLKIIKLIKKSGNIKLDNVLLSRLIITAAKCKHWTVAKYFISQIKPKGKNFIDLIKNMMIHGVDSRFIENQISNCPRQSLWVREIMVLFLSAVERSYSRIIKLLLDPNKNYHQFIFFTQVTINQIATMGDESLMRAVLEIKPNSDRLGLQPTAETIVLAAGSGNPQLTKWLIELCLRNSKKLSKFRHEHTGLSCS